MDQKVITNYATITSTCRSTIEKPLLSVLNLYKECIVKVRNILGQLLQESCIIFIV